jgi:hypothetical protein
MRRARWVRRPISLKPQTDPESVDVDAPIISVKGLRISRGDLPICEAKKKQVRGATSVERRCEGSVEVSRGHSRLEFDGAKAQTSREERNFHFDGAGDGDKEGSEAQISWTR